MTGFGKTCIVHKPDFVHSEIYKNHDEQYTRVKIHRDDRGIVVLQSLKVSHLMIIPNRFYDESPKLKIWMCELCMFLQIRSHLLILIIPGLRYSVEYGRYTQQYRTLIALCLLLKIQY